MIQSAAIPVERSFRYAFREATVATETLVYILHGYGQLAAYFIRKVEHLLPENVTFVVPEGMHRFYLNGTSGRVGASWMTKEARELDIRENTRMLDQLHEQLHAEFRPKRVVIIGFSQGGATATRWIANGKIRPDAFISWASVFPPDVAFPSALGEQLRDRIFVLGTNDPFFDEPSANETIAAYEQLGFRAVRFEGGHDLDAPLIEQLLML